MASGLLRLHHHPVHQPKSIAQAGAAALGDRKPVALASRHPARRGRPPLRPAQWGASVGSAEDIGPQPAALQRFSLDPRWPDGGGARHQPNARLGWHQHQQDGVI